MSTIRNRFDLFESLINIFQMTGIQPPSADQVLEKAVDAEYVKILDKCAERALRIAGEPIVPYHYILGAEWKSMASIESKDSHNSISISRGLLWSLNDIFLRLSANISFFSSGDQNRLFDEFKCDWTYPFAKVVPKIRFVDYTPVGISDSGTILSRYIEVFPHSECRRELAELLLEIAVTFIIIHEQTHYEAGHLEYLKDKMSSSIRGEGAAENCDLDNLESRTMEWEADFFAARGVTEIYCKPDRLSLLPIDYQNKEAWMIRAILTAVGTCFILMQKSALYHGKSNAHPSPRGRFINCCMHMETSLKKLGAHFHDHLSDQVCNAVAELGLVSNLAIQDGPLSGIVPGKYPVHHATSSLDFLDTRYAQDELQAYLAGCLANRRNIVVPPIGSVFRSLYENWFEENIELMNHQHLYFFDKLEPYRTPIGMIF